MNENFARPVRPERLPEGRFFAVFSNQSGGSFASVIIAVLFFMVFAAAGYRFFYMKPHEAALRQVQPVASDTAVNSGAQTSPIAITVISKTSLPEHVAAVPKATEQKDGSGEEQKAAQVEQYRVTVARNSAERSAESGMYSKDGGHFVVKYDGGENPVAGQLIGILLEAAYLKVGAEIGFYPEDKIEAVLYSREQFRDITRAPAWAGAIYDGRLKVPSGGITDKTELLEKVILHEYTHAVVHRISHGRAPTWLNEGIAQYEEGQDESLFKEDLKALALTNKVSLRHLEGSFMGFGGQSANAAYLLSLSATKYIIREYGISGVRRIFEELAKGQSLDASIQSALYVPYEDFEKIWLNSLKR